MTLRSPSHYSWPIVAVDLPQCLHGQIIIHSLHSGIQAYVNESIGANLVEILRVQAPKFPSEVKLSEQQRQY